MKILLAPLQRLGNLIDAQNKKIEEIHSVLTVDYKETSNRTNRELKAHTVLLGGIKGSLVKQDKKLEKIHSFLKADLKKASLQTHEELKTHTTLLGEIRDLLKNQEKQSKDSDSPPNVKLPGVISGIGAGLAIVTMAAALVAAAGIFSIMPNVAPSQLLTAIAIGATFVVLAPVFVEISESLRGGGLYERVVGGAAGVSTDVSCTKDLLENVGGTGLAMVSMAIAVTATSFIFTFMSQPSIAQIGTALLIGISMIPIAFAFGKFYNSLRKNKMGASKKGLLTLAMTGLAMVITAGAIAAVAFAFSKIPMDFKSPPPLEWTLKTGLALFVFSLPFTQTMRAIKGRSIKEIAFGAAALPLLTGAIMGVALVLNEFATAFKTMIPAEWSLKTGLALAVFSIPFVMVLKAIKGRSIKEMAFGAAALPLIAVGIMGTAWVFSYLSGIDAFNAPPIDWTLKTGAALAVFGISFVILANTVGKLSIKDVLFGVIGMAAVAVGILAVAWIFSILPDTFTEIPMGWVLGSAVALIGFGAVVGVIGAIIMATGGAGLAAIALGVVGMIVIAAGILAVAWILSHIPAGKLATVAKGLTEALLAPVNGIVDILARLKNEIGVENLLPLAGGIIAISASLLALAGATAGVAAGGLISGLANLGKQFTDAVASFFGAEESKGPMDILESLVGMAPQIGTLSESMGSLSKPLVTVVGLSTEDNIKAIKKLVKATVLDNESMNSLNGYTVKDYFTAYPAFLKNVAKGYQAISKAQSGMDVEVLDKTTQMVKALSYLNEVGGDNAMKKLGDQLVNAVQELAEMINKFGGNVDSQAESNDRAALSFESVSSAVSSLTDKVSSFVSGNESTPDETGDQTGPQPQQASNIQQAPTNMREVVDAIEELQRIVKSNEGFFA